MASRLAPCRPRPEVPVDPEEALDFLRLHQPMQSTRDCEGDTLRQLNEVRQLFAIHHDNRAIPLLLNVFGEGDGHGVYSMIETTIAAYPPSVVIPNIKEALNSPHKSVRTWCAEIACSVPDPSYTPLQSRMVECGDDEEREVAAECLSLIESQGER